ncbi:MAG: hypothetical protein AAGA20_18890 [Planctomycetota bacterium]
MTSSHRVPLACFAAASLAASASAQCPEEPTLQRWTGAGTVACPCFVAGEEFGAVLDAPASDYPIEILRIGIGWGSQFGGGPQSLEQSLNIYEGALPNPGPRSFSLPGPVLNDGFINEFDISGTPGDRIVESGPFTVTLELANGSTLFGPTAIHDGNGCQGGVNVVKAIPGGWIDVCTQGLTGDWIVQVVYRRVSCGPGGIGANYCGPSVINSSGSPAVMSAIGSTTVADNDVTIRASDLPIGAFGYFITSQTQGFNANPGGSQGNICLTGNVGRYAASILNSGPLGEFELPIDLAQMPTIPNQAVFAGQTWNFQAWFRDANPQVTSNFTDGLAITFQ